MKGNFSLNFFSAELVARSNSRVSVGRSLIESEEFDKRENITILRIIYSEIEDFDGQELEAWLDQFLVEAKRRYKALVAEVVITKPFLQLAANGDGEIVGFSLTADAIRFLSAEGIELLVDAT